MNKCDLVRLSGLSEELQNTLKGFEDIPIMEMSTITEEGVSEVKTEVCEKLLVYRIDSKVKAKKTESILNRLRVAVPTQRDEKERPPTIPG